MTKRFVPSDTKNEHKYLVIKTVGKGKRIDKQTNTTGHSVPNKLCINENSVLTV